MAARAVRVLLFDKSEATNWSVPWHQDRTIVVAERRDEALVTCWTVKRGRPCCEPPAALLEDMLTLRCHYDHEDAQSGALRVLPGSHAKGRMTQGEIAALADQTEARDLRVAAGDIVAMRPLLVHGSRRRQVPGRRRVLHVEFAAGDPPAPLRWAA